MASKTTTTTAATAATATTAASVLREESQDTIYNRFGYRELRFRVMGGDFVSNAKSVCNGWSHGMNSFSLKEIAKQMQLDTKGSVTVQVLEFLVDITKFVYQAPQFALSTTPIDAIVTILNNVCFDSNSVDLTEFKYLEATADTHADSPVFENSSLTMAHVAVLYALCTIYPEIDERFCLYSAKARGEFHRLLQQDCRGQACVLYPISWIAVTMPPNLDHPEQRARRSKQSIMYAHFASFFHKSINGKRSRLNPAWYAALTFRTGGRLPVCLALANMWLSLVYMVSVTVYTRPAKIKHISMTFTCTILACMGRALLDELPYKGSFKRIYPTYSDTLKAVERWTPPGHWGGSMISNRHEIINTLVIGACASRRTPEAAAIAVLFAYKSPSPTPCDEYIDPIIDMVKDSDQLKAIFRYTDYIASFKGLRTVLPSRDPSDSSSSDEEDRAKGVKSTIRNSTDNQPRRPILHETLAIVDGKRTVTRTEVIGSSSDSSSDSSSESEEEEEEANRVVTPVPTKKDNVVVPETPDLSEKDSSKRVRVDLSDSSSRRALFGDKKEDKEEEDDGVARPMTPLSLIKSDEGKVAPGAPIRPVREREGLDPVVFTRPSFPVNGLLCLLEDRRLLTPPETYFDQKWYFRQVEGWRTLAMEDGNDASVLVQLARWLQVDNLCPACKVFMRRCAERANVFALGVPSQIRIADSDVGRFKEYMDSTRCACKSKKEFSFLKSLFESVNQFRDEMIAFCEYESTQLDGYLKDVLSEDWNTL